MTGPRLLSRLRTALHIGHRHGLPTLARYAWQRVAAPRVARQGGPALAALAFVQRHPIGKVIGEGEVAANTLNWIIPPPGRGSGGHTTIFRFVTHLEALGFGCRIVIVGDTDLLAPAHALESIRDWFFPIRGPAYLGIESAPPAHITIATNWATAYLVRDFQPTRHRCYFVQDFEPWFYPAGSEQALAEATYRFGFHGITAGTWLRDVLARNYGMAADAVGFSYDRERCAPGTPRPPSTQTVLFYARPPTPRRGFELGMLALGEVKRRVPDARILVIGWDLAGFGVPFAFENPGVVGLEELPVYYRRSDVALVLSFSNLSLMPLELMACGTPVVSNRAPWTEWLLNDGNARLAEPSIEALADAVVAVLASPAEQERLREGGLRTAAATDWRVEGQRMAEVLHALQARDPVTPPS